MTKYFLITLFVYGHLFSNDKSWQELVNSIEDLARSAKPEILQKYAEWPKFAQVANCRDLNDQEIREEIARAKKVENMDSALREFDDRRFMFNFNAVKDISQEEKDFFRVLVSIEAKGLKAKIDCLKDKHENLRPGALKQKKESLQKKCVGLLKIKDLLSRE